jgi:hypothetical protein
MDTDIPNARYTFRSGKRIIIGLTLLLSGSGIRDYAVSRPACAVSGQVWSLIYLREKEKPSYVDKNRIYDSLVCFVLLSS